MSSADYDRLVNRLEVMTRERDDWKRACPQSSVCPKCGFQTVYRYPEPPGADALVLVQEIQRLRALLREVVATGGRHMGLHPDGIELVLPHDLHRRLTAAALEEHNG